MEYSENLTVFERILLYNRIQDIKNHEEQVTQNDINEMKAKVEANKSKQRK